MNKYSIESYKVYDKPICGCGDCSGTSRTHWNVKVLSTNGYWLPVERAQNLPTERHATDIIFDLLGAEVEYDEE